MIKKFVICLLIVIFAFNISFVSVNAQQTSFVDNVSSFSRNAVRNVRIKTFEKKIVLKWNSIQGASEYKIYCYNKKWKKIATVKNTAYVHKNLNSATKYKYNIVACAYDNNKKIIKSKNCIVAAVTTPKKVEVKQATTSTGEKNNIVWEKTKCSGYLVYRSDKKNSGFKRIATVYRASNTKYTDKNVSSNKKYYYRIKAFKMLNGKKYIGKFSKAVKAVSFSSLKAKINSKISGYSGTWSVYVKDLSTSDSLTINNTQQYSASLIKAFAMASTYDQIEKGRIKETEEVKSLLNRMITVSDNDGFNLLIRKHDKNNDFKKGASVANDFLKDNGYKDTVVGSCLRPTAYEYVWYGVRNTTTVKDCGKLLESIYKGTCVSREASEKMLELLLDQQITNKIPAGVPSGVKVANKTGEMSKAQHDIAIVYSPRSTYIICVMSSNGGSFAASNIKSISSLVYNYLNY